MSGSRSRAAKVISQVRNYLNRDGLGPTLVRAVTGSAGLRLTGMAFGFLVGVQLARGLGAEGYGIYGLAMSTIALLTVPTEFGLPQLVTREVATAHAQGAWGTMRGVLRWSMRSSMMIAAFVALLLLAVLTGNDSFGTPLAGTLLAGLVLVPLVALLSLHSAALRGMQQIVRGQLPEVALRPAFHSVLLLTASVILVPITPPIAMWLGVLATAISLVYAHHLLKRAMVPQVYIAQPITTPGSWWSSAIPMAMTEGMRLLQAHSLIFILGAMATLSDVGVFRMAASTAALVAMPLSLFNIVSMPVVAKLHATGQQAQLSRMLSLVSAGMLAGVLALSLPFFVAGEWLLGRVFGQEFSEGSSPLMVLCLAALVNALFGINAAVLNMTGNPRRVTRASALALCTLAATSPVMISNYGVMGAAYSNLMSVTVWNALMWRDCKRILALDTGVWALFLKAASKNK